MTPLVDIITLVHNRADVTAEFLNRLAHADPGVPYRLTVVDNGSGIPVQRLLKWWKKNTRKWVPWAKYRQLNLHVIPSKVNWGFSGGNNLAAKQSHAEWLLFINNDAFPARANWVKTMIETADDCGWAAIGPISNAVLGLQHEVHSGKWDRVHRTKFLSGFCFLVRREAFEKVGGWDEIFFNGDEDLDLSLRLRRAGFTLGIDRKIHVHHQNQATLSEVARQQGATPTDWYARTRQILTEKWGERILRDLWFWEDLRLPRTQWSKIGVIGNGWFYGHPGTPAEAAKQLGKLRSESAKARSRGRQDPLGELQAGYDYSARGWCWITDCRASTRLGTDGRGADDYIYGKTDFDREHWYLATKTQGAPPKKPARVSDYDFRKPQAAGI